MLSNNTGVKSDAGGQHIVAKQNGKLCVKSDTGGQHNEQGILGETKRGGGHIVVKQNQELCVKSDTGAGTSS